MAKAKPKLKQFEVTAVIPTGQYANLQPKLVMEAEDFEGAYKFAMPHIQRVAREFGEQGNRLAEGGGDVAPVERQTLKCFATGTEVYFDKAGHTYLDGKGNAYLSGSAFASQFEYEFNKHLILPKYAAKHGVEESFIEEMWQAKGAASTTFGTALHQALETYGKYKDLCDKIGKDIGIHPTLLPIVEAFFEGREDEQAVYEPFVADERNLRCGQIDRLLITGEKSCIIEDYKTNGDLHKQGKPASLKAPYSYLPNTPIGKYTLQLSFYAAILEAAGWTVEGLRLHWWSGDEWETFDLKAVQLDVPQKKIDMSKVV